LRYGKRLVSRKVQLRVRFLLQRGKVVQKRRFLAGFFPLDGFHGKPPGILYPLQGGYGFGLLLPLGGRLDGETYSPAGGRHFELPKLGGYKILVLQIAAAYHYKRGCLHPAQREHTLPGGYAQRLGGVYPYQPVRFAAGLGREVEVIVTLSRLQVFQPLTDCLVGKAAYPQAHKGLGTAQIVIDVTVYQFALTPGIGGDNNLVALVEHFLYHFQLFQHAGVFLVAFLGFHLTGD